MSSVSLQLKDIHASYLQKEILRGVSLSLCVGEIVKLSGENGAGKSTVMKVVAGLLRPLRGAVLFDGRDIGSLQVEDRQGLGIGFLMQGGRVFPSLTVQENYDLAVNRAREDVGGRVPLLGRWFGSSLRERRTDQAGILSGGQRQMLAIELALAQKPRLLLLDEPLGALSDEVATQTLEALASYVRNNAAAALLIEHSPLANRYMTRRLHLIDGSLSE